MGWYCPLRYLENYLYALHDAEATHTGPFMINFLDHLIYPDLPETYIRIGGILSNTSSLPIHCLQASIGYLTNTMEASFPWIL